MDEENGNYVDDDSGNEMHGVASTDVVTARGKSTRGRYFDSKGLINIPHRPVMELMKTSFTFSGWIKIQNYTYPLTTFAVIQGFGCYFPPG